MSEEFLYGVEIGTFVEHGCGEGVTEGVRRFFSGFRWLKLAVDSIVDLSWGYAFPFHHEKWGRGFKIGPDSVAQLLPAFYLLNKSVRRGYDSLFRAFSKNAYFSGRGGYVGIADGYELSAADAE